MNAGLARARRVVMGVPERQILAFKGGDTPNWQHLEKAVRAAIGGYHAVVDGGDLTAVMDRIAGIPGPLAGYAHEGVAMGLTGLDSVMPGKRSRFREFLAGPGDAHAYMVHIGAGEALARLRRHPEPFLARLDDHALRWLVLDGYGFHQGFFARRKFVERQIIPTFLSPYARRVFDQGVGRSIWFSTGAAIDQIAAHIAAFTPDRHGDLWLGVGVACSYVGGVSREDIERLQEVSGSHLARVATGAAFAARGRHRAGNPQPDTDLACQLLCGVDSHNASQVVEAAFASLPVHPDRPGYELVQIELASVFGQPNLPIGSRAR
ncbi:DUF1702 family protein [Mycobacterium sp. BMJ-28]